ncbi:XK-related protein 6 [Armadillidium nasatum]|uniref:XK-related protein n=1 Tax=Armadillidium nasatum TaxID=96803 RepID=A0A5N5TMI3_9CRUS|nr:XK-related protein 6 [Armadillidium nasatum]
MVYEFLPLCDVLFNIISLASYFCDVVFDVVTVYTLYAENEKTGILFRYFRLFIPVDLRHVKNDVRDLCLLRLIHAFCEAAPMLLLQLYLIWLKPSFMALTDLNIVSTVLSLFSVCWALASFNKNVRRHNVHRLVLTWLGVIFQLLWRLGTVTSRSLALTVYATLYGYWVLLVMALHWISMFLWLISPKNVFHGEKMPMLKKIGFSMLIAFCYIFCYINLQEINPRQKMLTFYLTMVLENTLLVSVWLGGLHDTPWYKYGVTSLIFLSFFLGMVFMGLYYRHFHVRRLKHSYHPQEVDKLYSACTGCQLGECSVKSHKMPYPHFWNELSSTPNEENNLQQTKMTNLAVTESQTRPLYPTREGFSVPGVFNCRFNPVIKRKKKKPTSFVPSPIPVVGLNLSNSGGGGGGEGGGGGGGGGGRLQYPFWKRPLPSNPIASDHEGSICSRVNIQQKLQEKKQQQIAELRKIEEEIRAGKLKRPQPSDISDTGTLRQPIPRAKKQPWMRPEPLQYPYVVSDPSGAPPPRKPRSQTPEILLSPHYLDNTRIYYEYQDPRWKYGNNYHLPSDDMSGSSISKHSSRKSKKVDTSNDENKEKVFYKSYRIPSDLDSQISLPRSYTLPREFKYYRRPKSRKTLRMDHFLASTNSSDGDVDSCDENDHDELGTSGNGVMVHPGHSHYPHHHYHPYHQPLLTHPSAGDRMGPPTPRQNPALKTKHTPFHRGVTNTHETKL